MTWNVWCNLCKWKSPLCVWLHAYACSSWHRSAEPGLWAACKSPHLGRENQCLTPQLFAQPFLCLDSLTAHKEMFTVRTHTCRLSRTWTAYCWWFLVFLCGHVSGKWRAGPLMQPLITEKTSVGGGEKLHTSSWKLDDCSMCSSLTGEL